MREFGGPRGEIREPSWLEKQKQKARSLAKVAAFGAALASATTHEEGEHQEVSASHTEAHHEIIDPYFDNNPDYFHEVKGGEYSKEEREERTKTLPNGEIIFEDAGIIFYKVQKGDSLSAIRKALTAYDRFSYLKDQTEKIDSFNIPAKELRAGMWIPIPIDDERRTLDDGEFLKYAERALGDLQHHRVYGPAIDALLKSVSKKELLASIGAVAKQESGGKIGSFALHRYEPRHRAFSFSFFHVLMRDAGLKARRKLDMTEGQTYHPKNAVKLFLAFLFEKSRDTHHTPQDFFPIDKHSEQFAEFYNGTRWEKTNPHYAEQITKYYRETAEKF